MLCIHVISLQLTSHFFGRYEKKLKFLRPSPGFEPSKPIYMYRYMHRFYNGFGTDKLRKSTSRNKHIELCIYKSSMDNLI